MANITQIWSKFCSQKGSLICWAERPNLRVDATRILLAQNKCLFFTQEVVYYAQLICRAGTSLWIQCGVLIRMRGYVLI